MNNEWRARIIVEEPRELTFIEKAAALWNEAKYPLGFALIITFLVMK